MCAADDHAPFYNCSLPKVRAGRSGSPGRRSGAPRALGVAHLCGERVDVLCGVCMMLRWPGARTRGGSSLYIDCLAGMLRPLTAAGTARAADAPTPAFVRRFATTPARAGAARPPFHRRGEVHGLESSAARERGPRSTPLPSPRPPAARPQEVIKCARQGTHCDSSDCAVCQVGGWRRPPSDLPAAIRHTIARAAALLTRRAFTLAAAGLVAAPPGRPPGTGRPAQAPRGRRAAGAPTRASPPHTPPRCNCTCPARHPPPPPPPCRAWSTAPGSTPSCATKWAATWASACRQPASSRAPAMATAATRMTRCCTASAAAAPAWRPCSAPPA